MGQGTKEGREVWRGARSGGPDRFLGFSVHDHMGNCIRAGTEIWVPDVQPTVLLLFFVQPS